MDQSTHAALRKTPWNKGVSLPVTPSFEPSAGTVGARTKVTPRRSVLD
jgi:hypothetical protein